MNRPHIVITALVTTLVVPACSSPRAPQSPAVASAPKVTYNGGEASHSRAADGMMITVPAGMYIAGSTPEERAHAYDDYLATAGHDAARKHNWFEREEERHQARLDGFRIDVMPVTQVAYAEFVRDTGTRRPFIDEATWQKQGFVQNYATQVVRFNWTTDAPPAGREDHPAVLVTWNDARAYCAWRGALVGEPRHLPSAAEFEKAARGEDGRTYPWGNEWDATKLNSQVPRPFGQEAERSDAPVRLESPVDTVAVGSFPDGASPYGMLDAAGNIFQWTSTPWPYAKDTITVKGSAWDDFAGVGRGAARHGRRASVRHVLVGFRCAADLAPGK